MANIQKSASAIVCFLCLLGSLPASADLVFGAPPRESEARADAIYGPITDFLTQVTGQKVTYKFVDNWLSYQSDILKGRYDIVFDGPAFVGWRMAKFGWNPLVKMGGNLVFVVITKNTNTSINKLDDLAGYTLCGFAPPNLATLMVLVEFDNPSRQPNLTAVPTFKDAYRDVVSGKCTAGIMQAKLFDNMNAESQAAKVIFRSKPLPNQAFSAGPRVSPTLQQKIASALLSPEGNAATQKLRTEFKMKQFVPATPQEYAGLGKYLRDVWGFDLTSPTGQ